MKKIIFIILLAFSIVILADDPEYTLSYRTIQTGTSINYEVILTVNGPQIQDGYYTFQRRECDYNTGSVIGSWTEFATPYLNTTVDIRAPGTRWQYIAYINDSYMIYSANIVDVKLIDLSLPPVHSPK